MKLQKIFFLVAVASIFSGCKSSQKTVDSSWVDHAVSVGQTQMSIQGTKASQSLKMPRSVWKSSDVDLISHQLGRVVKQSKLEKIPEGQLGEIKYCNGIYGWTIGFLPGSLWYVSQLTDDEGIEKNAKALTNLLNPVRSYSGSHDIGFMINCSYGNALRFAPNDSIVDVIRSSAANLASRFDSKIGCIKSWDTNHWNFPVIIDNMMNLELLFKATALTGDSTYYNVAVSHANKTIQNHFREDSSSYHVVSYNDDGSVEEKCTHQGKADDSKWARGQAWGLYGYTVCYRYTHDVSYLKQAMDIADMVMSNVTTEDAIPYWDYDAPNEVNTPRDVSAASITASALLELAKQVSEQNEAVITDRASAYSEYAVKILKSLSSSDYLAVPGQNDGFILTHSTGSLPSGSEVDVPLNYADYYFLEALYRYKSEF